MASTKDAIYWVTPEETRPRQESLTIDWDCPCLAKVRNGPCFEEFKAALECYNASNEKEKGSDCEIPFFAMQDCIAKNPEQKPS